MKLTRWKRDDGFYSDKHPSGGIWVHLILGVLAFAAGCGVGVWGYASWLARDRAETVIETFCREQND